MAPADIERQIERYFVTPGQALSCKVGTLTSLELRERARAAQGPGSATILPRSVTGFSGS